MNSCESVSAITAIACATANCTALEDLPIISAFFTQLSATLASIVVQEEKRINVRTTLLPNLHPFVEPVNEVLLEENA